MEEDNNYMYRYEESRYSVGCDEYGNALSGYTLKVELRTYPVVKTTLKGVWISIHGAKKFVLLDAKKQYACKTTEGAKISFIARKELQIKILKKQLDQAVTALHTIQQGTCGKEDSDMVFTVSVWNGQGV